MTLLRRMAFAVTAAFTGFVGIIVVGYVVTDVGGWMAVGLVAGVVVPLAMLCLLAHYRPSAAVPVLAVAACVPVGWGVMQMFDYDRWSAWEDEHGPLSLVVVLVVAAALAVLGLSRPVPAGVLLLVVTVLPLVLAALGAGSDWWRPLSIGTILVPLVVSGVLFVVAGRQDAGEGAPRPRAGSPTDGWARHPS